MPRIEARLTPDEKEAWRRFCQARGVSEADMLRLMIERVSGGEVPVAFSGLTDNKSEKLTLRLSAKDQQRLIKRARAEGYPSRTTWTTALVLATLYREPVLTDTEITALRESNRELAAIGRNLNQIAKALNIEFRNSDKMTLEAVLALKKQIDQQREEVAVLLNKNMNRWRIDE